MKRKYPAFVALVLLASCVQACAPYRLADGPIDTAYVALNDYEQAQKTAISMQRDPNVPEQVKDALARADYAVNPRDNPQASSIEITRQKLREYVLLKAEIDALRSSGIEPTAEKIALAQTALGALRGAITTIEPLIEHLQQLVADF